MDNKGEFNKSAGEKTSLWDSLIDWRRIEPGQRRGDNGAIVRGPREELMDELRNIDDMLIHGRIDKEKAKRYREEVLSRFNYKPQDQPEQPTATKPEPGPQWDPRLTEEQRLDMLEKGIYEPVGPEYEQALGEFGLKEDTERPEFGLLQKTDKSPKEPIKKEPEQPTVTKPEPEPKPEPKPEKTEKPEWDPRLTEAQLLEMRRKGIYVPAGQKYKQALAGFGLTDPTSAPDKKPDTPTSAPDKPAESAPENPINKEIEDLNQRIDQAIKDGKLSPEEATAFMRKKILEIKSQASSAAAKARDKTLAEARDKDLAATKRIEEIKEKLKRIKEQKELLEKGFPLTVIGAEFDYDKREIAHDLASNALSEEVAKSGLIKKLWKGVLFKRHYEKKYAVEFLSDERTINIGDEQLTIEELIAHRKKFVLDATENMEQIHEIFDRKKGNEASDSERLTEADGEITAAIKSAIEEYASAEVPDGGNLEDLKQKFDDKIKKIKDEAKNKGKNVDMLIGNYRDVAIQARYFVEHGISIEDVMDGFKVYHAEVLDSIPRDGTRRGSIEKIMNWIGKDTTPTGTEQPDSGEDSGEDDSGDNSGDNSEDGGSKPETGAGQSDDSEAKRLIEDSRDAIGGDAGVKIMTDTSPMTLEAQARWANWWNGLSEDGKNKARELAGKIKASNPEWGRGIRSFIEQQ